MLSSTKPNVPYLWSGHPSLYLYVGHYALSFIAILLILRLEHALYPADSYFHLATFLWYVVFGLPFSEWPLFHGAFFSMMFLQILCWGIVAYNAFLILQTKLTSYYLTPEEIIIRHISWTGLYTDHTELYRLVDFTLELPIIGMIFKFSTLRIQSTDQTHPHLFLEGIQGGREVLRMIREQTEKCRMQKGVREFTSASPY
jgi:hypothetical protein